MSRFGLGIVSASAPAGVTMVAGQEGSEQIFGYYTGAGGGTPYGSISGQPLAGQTLLLLDYRFQFGYQQNFFQMAGNIVSLLNPMSLIVDGVAYPLAEATFPPTYEPGDDFTYVYWEDPKFGPIFANGVSYNIRIE